MEIGFLNKPPQTEFALYFVDLPIWLLSLDKSFASRVVICGFESSSALMEYFSNRELDPFLINKSMTQLGLSRFQYAGSQSPPLNAIKLVSGPVPFLRTEAKRLGHLPALYLATSSLKKDLKGLPDHVTWECCRHESFGGSTTFSALLGVCGIAGYKVVVTKIRRALGHILDHGVRPNPVPGPLHLISTALLVGSRLNPDNFDQEICYRTNFFANGWGIRKLIVDELGIAFGLSSWLRARKLKPHHLEEVVPVQIIDGCLQGLLRL